MKVLLENFRSFAGRHEIELRPLTILTGENSTGKTSLLAALSLIFDPGSFPLKPTFNQKPYALGGYDTIATNDAEPSDHTGEFSLGYISTDGDKTIECRYLSIDGMPAVSHLRVRSKDYTLSVDLHREGTAITSGTVSGKIGALSVEGSSPIQEVKAIGIHEIIPLLILKTIREEESLRKEEIKLIADFIEIGAAILFSEATSLAPVRSQPKRTYERVADEYDPRGRHVPSVLAKAFREPSQKELREDIRGQIQEFGQASGLFDDVRIRNLGERPTDPFQVEVQRNRRWDNVVDVGYGVGQVLPILIEALTAVSSDVLLLQQPEVHLHPRAQAELGSFFAKVIADRDVQIVLETHSDYVVDRIRSEIARDTLDAEDARLLFFEKNDAKTSIHPIHFDGGGNVVNPPDSYRSFFMQEEIALLSRSIS